MDLAATHIPLLSFILSKCSAGDHVVEFGSGFYSTFMMKLFAENNDIQFRSYETDFTWRELFKGMESDNVKIGGYSTFSELLDILEEVKELKPRMIFVDSGFIEGKNTYRNDIILNLIDYVDYVVVHDTEPDKKDEYKYDFSHAKYSNSIWIKNIQTTVLSNKIDVSKFKLNF
jgi:hypothetical protein